jgi:hypothetical protein
MLHNNIQQFILATYEGVICDRIYNLKAMLFVVKFKRIVGAFIFHFYVRGHTQILYCERCFTLY